MVVKGPGVAADPNGIAIPTSHVDIIPTLLGLAGVDVEQAASTVARKHTETRAFPGRDLSAVLAGRSSAAAMATPIYFMTEDAITSGASQRNVLTGESFDSLPAPACIETVVAELPTGPDGQAELWKLNHFYERLDAWHEAHGRPAPAAASPAAEPELELHNLSTDPEERVNLATSAPDARSRMETVLEQQRDEKRLLPTLWSVAPRRRSWT
jgi:arylsulfatase A-like enzyme